MKAGKLVTMMLGAVLMTGMGMTTASAGMGEKCGGGKCGAGKCGGTMKKRTMTFEDRKAKQLKVIRKIESCMQEATNPKEMKVCRQKIVRMAKKIRNLRVSKAHAGRKCGAGKCGAGKCGGQ